MAASNTEVDTANRRSNGTPPSKLKQLMAHSIPDSCSHAQESLTYPRCSDIKQTLGGKYALKLHLFFVGHYVLGRAGFGGNAPGIAGLRCGGNRSQRCDRPGLYSGRVRGK